MVGLIAVHVRSALPLLQYKQEQGQMTDLLSCRYLLREAVEGAQAPDQIGAIDADHLAGGKEFLQNLLGALVVGMVEEGQQHDMISDIEIGITGRKALPLVDDGWRHRQGDDLQRLAVLIAHRP